MLITIPNAEGLDARLIDSFKQIRGGRRPSDRRFKVEERASSFPICPRKYVIYRRLPPNRRPFIEESFMSDAATLQGTALHLALQKWFGLEMDRYAYGNWECPKCRKIRRHRRGVQICKSCHDTMVYREYGIVPTSDVLFTGHIDMILWYRDLSFLIDFKGSSLDKIKDIQASGPEYRHYLQANAYANAINLGGQDVGKLRRINKIVIIYVDRGKPWWTWWPVQMPVSKRVFRETTALIKKGHQGLRDGVVPPGLCDTPEDYGAKYCEVRDICFSPLIETKLSDTTHPLDRTPQSRKLESLIHKRLKKDEADVY